MICVAEPQASNRCLISSFSDRFLPFHGLPRRLREAFVVPAWNPRKFTVLPSVARTRVCRSGTVSLVGLGVGGVAKESNARWAGDSEWCYRTHLTKSCGRVKLRRPEEVTSHPSL